MFKTTMLLAFIVMIAGNAYSPSSDWELDIDGLQFDSMTKSIFLNSTHLVIATQLRTLDQHYQVSLKLINIHKKSIDKQSLIGDQNSDYYSPQILTVGKYIYITYINQVSSIVNAKITKFDQNLVKQEGELILGEALESAKFEIHLKLSLLNKNSLAILWYSRGRDTIQRQWNFRQLDIESGSLSETTFLPNSKLISVAQNNYGITVFAQYDQPNYFVYLSKLSNQLTTRTLYVTQGMNDINVFNLPNNNFIVVQTSDTTVFRYFNHQLEPIRHPITYYWITNGLYAQMLDYNLYFFSGQSSLLKVYQLDVSNPFKEVPWNQQERQIYLWKNFESQSVQADIINQIFYIRWLQKKNYYDQYAQLSIFYFDMSTFVDECISNCITCNPRQTCLQCQVGYILNDNKCVPKCTDNCQFCSNPYYCDQCKEGFQYTLNNLCINPILDDIDLQISDEETPKDKPKMLVIDNELIVLYGIFQQTNSYLKIKKLNSQGQEIISTNLIDEQLKDYDLTNGIDDNTFILLVKWSKDGVSSIIKYVIKVLDLSIQSQDIFRSNITPDMKGDQLKIVKFENNYIFYFYITYESNYYYVNYLKQSQNGDQQTLSSLQISQFDGIQLQTFVAEYLYLNIKAINQESLYYFYNDYPYQSSTKDIGQKYDSKYQKQFYLDQQTFSYTDYENSTQRIYLNVTNKKTQISYTSRNPREHSIQKIGENDLLVLWLGVSNIQKTQFEQVYLQRVSLETLQISNLKQSVCPKNCKACDKFGVCNQCISENYNILSGKCQLICPQNCNKCEKENECQACDQSYYLDKNLNCVLSEQSYIYKIDDMKQLYVSGSVDPSLQSVYYVSNNTKLEVIYEELDRKGDPLSGQIRISIDEDKVLQKQLKVIKRNQFIYVSYTRLNGVNMQQVFVVLDKFYQIYSRSYMDIAEESDFTIGKDLEIYWISTAQYGDRKYIKISIYQISGNVLISQGFIISEESIQEINQYRNIRFANNDDSYKILILFTTVENQIATDKFIVLDSKVQKTTTFKQHSNGKYFNNQLQTWFVVYDVISDIINLNFYNNDDLLQSYYQIKSINPIITHKIYTNDYYVYLIYIEQGTLMQIKIIQYNINGEFQKDILVQTNEVQIIGLNAAVNNEFILLAWSSLYKSVYQVLLTKELAIVPIDQEVCIQNCDICETNDSCSQCALGYYYDSNCKPICVDNCLSCSKPYICDFCSAGYIYINLQCQELAKLQIEQSICSETCYGVASMITFYDYRYQDNMLLLTYANYDNQQYNILAQVFDSSINPSTYAKQPLITSSAQIQYHQTYPLGMEFLMIWLSGNCQVQCRLMLQFFKIDLTSNTNPVELRIMTVDISQFNIQITNQYYDFVFVWTELDSNSLPQSYACQYNQQTGVFRIENINQNSNDISTTPNIVSFEKFKIVYLKNSNTINLLILDTQKTYQEIYKTENQISSLSISNTFFSQGYYSKRLLIAWIEISSDMTPNYQLKILICDLDYNILFPSLTFPTQNKIISNLQLKSLFYGDKLYIAYIEQEGENVKRIKTYLTNFQDISDSHFNSDSQYQNIYSTLVLDYSYKTFGLISYESFYTTFRGISDNKEQIFVQKNLQGQNNIPVCDQNCFYCDQDTICQICKEGYELKDKQCQKKLPNYCEAGYYGICQQCSDGYSLKGNECILYDPEYNQFKMNIYTLQSKQRISTFSNGDYIVVWFRKYYENQGTGIFMSLFNSHGEKLIDETRITLSSVGIQMFPDVQVLSYDEFIVVWIDGDISINANIKKQRFTKQFVRIGEEITIKQNIKLNNAKQYDTPLVISSIINGYLITWTQNIEQIDKLYAIFYDQSGNYQSEIDLSQDYQIKHTEPVIASNQQIIVILWESNQGIVASIFSLNNVLINTKILSKNGQAPSITVLNNGNFITVWREQVQLKNLFYSFKILHTQYLSDMSTYLYSLTFGENDCNQNNPDVINTSNGYAMIFENVYNNDIRNLKLQYFDLGGLTTNLITVTNQKGLYPHHPQLNALPQGEFIATWSSTPINGLTVDVYMKRYNSQGEQLLLSTIVCINNCQTCKVNDICEICMDGYLLVQQRCFKEIQNCNTYQQDSNELVCTQCNSEYQLTNNKCISLINNELLVEFINNISLVYRQVILSNDNILYLWVDGVNLIVQRFDKYGNPLTLPKSQQFSQNIRFIDVLAIQDDYMIAIRVDYSIVVQIFDSNDYQVTQTSIQTLYSQELQSLSKFGVQIKQTGQFKYSVLYLIVSVQNQIELHIAQMSITQGQSAQLFFENERLINFVKQPQDIQLNEELKILLAAGNESKYGYYYLSYDYQGNTQSNYKVLLNNRRIEYKIAQLSQTTFIEFWTELELMSYQIYYQVKRFDNTNVTDQIKISSSSIYQMDLQINLKKNAIILTWREGSDAIDLNSNTFHQGLVISPETFAATKIEFNQIVSPFAEKLKISQLTNDDLIFSFVTQVEDNNVLIGVKVSPQGQKLTFSGLRCESGCQECTNQGCLKCIDSYIIREGKCFIKQASCLNFQPDCQTCLSGFYKTKYMTCEMISQFLETKMKEITSPYYKQAFYQDGRSVIVENKQSSYLELTYYGADSIIQKEATIIHQITSGSIRDFDLLITKNNVLSVIVYISEYCQDCQSKFSVLQFDEQFIKIGDQITVYTIQDFNNFKLKALANNQIGIAIQKGDQIYIAVYNNDLTSFIGNNVVKSPSIIQDFDLTSTLDNIIFTYSFTANQAVTVVIIYDNKINFIKDITIIDTQPIKITTNSIGQVIVASKNQINIIEKLQILYSVEHTNLNPQQISTSSLNQIVVLSQQNQLILAIYDKQGKYLFEQQVNMQSYAVSPYDLYTLSNNDFIIRFQQYIQLSYYQNLQFTFISRFDQYGKSKAIGDVVCPQNCEICINSSSCQICANLYERNEGSLLCEKLCTIKNCQSCEKSDCDVCQEGYSLDPTGQCALIVYQPLPDTQQNIDQCSQPIEIRSIKFVNNEYAFVYFCLNTIQIKKFNTLNEQLLDYSTTFQSPYIKFDAQQVNGLVYILLIFSDSNNQATLYKLDIDFTQLNVATKITNENLITNLFFASIGSQYMIILSDNKFFTFDSAQQICEVSSYYIFDQKYGDKKLNEMKGFQTPKTANDCNRSIVKQIKGADVFYVIINTQWDVQIAKFDAMGPIGYQILQMQSASDVYLDITTSRIVTLSKSIGFNFWQLSIWDKTLIISYYNDQNFLFGNYEFSIVATEQNILIAWSNQGSIEYKLLDISGNLINNKIIQNSGTSIKPQLIKLQNNAVGISWTGLNKEYELSFAVIDQQGEIIKPTIICSNNCIICTSSTVCTQCDIGFTLINSTCVKQCNTCVTQCSDICQSCDYNSGICLKCGKNYIPSAETCIIDEILQSAIQINEYSSLSQTQADSVSLSDGSLITVWASMGEDGDSWGVYAQLQDPQGNKVGDNIRVSESTQGSQHSPQIIRFIDDTVLIIFIDGNPSIQASLKGVRFSNQMNKYGNEQLFATFSYTGFSMQWQNVFQVESLRSGGFVIALVFDQQDQQYQKQISLTFYDGQYNILNQNTLISEAQFKIASTSYNFVFISPIYDPSVGYFINAKIYSHDGQFIQNTPIVDYDTFYNSKLVGNNQYYAILSSKQEGKIVFFQLFDAQLNRQGNTIIIEQDNSNQYSSNQISITTFTSGFFILVLHPNYSGQSYYNQYFIDLNWQVTFIKKLTLTTQEGILISVESVNNQYFLIWVSDIESIIDISNIYVQRFSKQGELMKIDEIACSPNCEKCEISQTCTICVDNYKILDSLCTPICEQHCIICTTPNQCDVCESGYYLPIAEKCSPLPITYYEPETLFTYSQNTYVYDSNYISSDTFVVYSREYSWVEGRFLFMMNLIQNKQVIKRIQPLSYTIPQFQSVFSYYLDNNFILVFYYSDRIIVKRYDEKSNQIFDQQVPWPSNIGLYVQSNTLVEPLQNNQYSFIYLYVNNAVPYDANDRNTVHRAVLDQQLNFVSDPEQILALGAGYLEERNKYSMQISQYGPKEILYIVTKDNISQINCQSTSYASSNCKIFKIANGNYVQILWPYQDINNYNYRYYYIGQLTISYRILDSNYQVLTSQEKVIENDYLRQNFLKVYTFDDSFTIVLQQFNYLHQKYSQIVAQKFDNSGEKIGSYYFINSLKSFSFVQTDNYENGYIVLWQEADNYNKQNIMYAKQFDQNGIEVPWSNNAKCIPYCDICINSYYCQTCSTNYKLDANYQCQVICPVNCDVCTTPDQCQSCTSGYQVMDNLCSKIQCIDNCAQCSLEGVCNSCDTNYQFNTDKTSCQPICVSNCSTCTTPLECDTCSSGFEITADKKCQQYDYVSVVTQIQTTVGTPMIATFPNGDYIELFFQSGDNAGVYFQLYNKDGVKVGDLTKVGGISRRRLLTTTIQQFAADLAINTNSFAVLWLDASSESTLAKLQKFDQQGQATSDIVELGAYPQTDLTNIKLPCQISTTSNNNFLVSYIAQSDDNYSLFVETFDSQLTKKGTVKEIKKVNALSAPSITADENGIISLTYQSEGYLFVQQLTEDGEAIDSPKAISDTDSLIIRTTNLENGFIVFLWEVKNIQLSIQQFSLNFQLISKDLKTKSQIFTLGTIQKASLDPDIQSFNQGFITVWKLTDNFYKTSGLQFQIFDSLGSPTTNAIDVQIDGLYPDNPRIQIMNDAQFMITCTAKNIDTDGTILGDGIFMQKYNEKGIIIQDQKSLDLCSYQCLSCQSPLICLKCQNGYYLSSNNQCVIDCGSFCETCDIPLTCKSCKNGYKLKDNSICEETECSKGFIRNSKTKLCESQECPENCDQCSQNQCIACQQGYTLSTQNSCIQLQVTQTNPGQVMYMIIIIILAAALVGLAFCAFSQYSQKKSLLNQKFHQVHPISAVNEGCNQTQIVMRE